MPEKWFSEEYEERKAKTLVPEELVFQTKHKIALGLIDPIAKGGTVSGKMVGLRCCIWC